MRIDGRQPDELRLLSFQRGFTRQAPGSVLAIMGRTTVLCTCSVEPGVPPFLLGSGKGWLTAEYGMLPGSTPTRKPRDRGGKVDGRSVEIQRLIGRSLRAVVDLEKLGERTLWLDCDVLDADGGTRTAELLGLPHRLTAADMDYTEEQIGAGYALPTPGSREALKLLATREGVLLDPTYSAKAMAGLIADVRRGRFRPGEVVVFIHTGGLPAMFAYKDEILAAL